jgi:hypothetical protein
MNQGGTGSIFGAGYRLARDAHAARIAWASVACALLLGSQARAVVLSSGNGNFGTTAAQGLIDAGGPGDNNTPGYVNVGRSSTGNASVTYLGNRWAITAGHVALGTVHGPVRFGGVPYNVIDSSIQYLVNPDSSLADLKLFRIDADPGLPVITSQLINSVAPSGRQIMIGNGLDIEVTPQGAPVQYYWNVDDSGPVWNWQTQSPPANPGPNDYSGFNVLANHRIRWGDNNVLDTGLFELTASDENNNPLWVHGYSTEFDGGDGQDEYGPGPDLASEAQLSQGDSGGAVFTLVGNQWKLAGIMVAFEELYNNQPPAPSGFPYAIFGNEALIADLSVYRDQITSIVPEPGGLALAAMAIMGLAGMAYRRRRRPAEAAATRT